LDNLKRNIIIGSAWSFIGQIGFVTIGLITNIILARILMPIDFGKIGIIMFFIFLSNVFIEGGLSGALIRKKEINNIDYSTVFVFNLLISIACYSLLIPSSRYISEFYKDPELRRLILVVGTILFINAFQITHNAKLVRELKFKRLSFYRFISFFFSSALCIVFAFFGFGIWALIIQQLCSALFLTFCFWIYEGFFISFRFSSLSFKHLYLFGVNTTLASLLSTFFDNIYQLIIGRSFSLTQVGLYYQAKKLQEIPNSMINMLMQGAIFSSLSKFQDEKVLFESLYNKIMILLAVAMGVITSFIFMYAKNIIIILYGHEWIGSVFYIKVLCLASFFYVHELLKRTIFKVFNYTGKILKLELIKKVIQSLTIIAGVIFSSLDILLYGFILASIISYLINYYYSQKILGNDSWFEIRVLLKVIFAAILSVIITSYIFDLMRIDSLYFFLLFPIFLISYLLILRWMNVLNIYHEIKVFMNFIKKSN